MTERVFPSKPSTTTNGVATKTTTANPQFPATKAQIYNANRPAYRPQPYHDRRRRSFCCSCFLWTTLVLIILIVLAAATAGVLYLLYRPHRPSYTLTSLKINEFNLSKSSHITSKITLIVTSRNPNKKITFIYNPIKVIITSNEVNLGTGEFPAFSHGGKNTTVLRATASSGGESVDGAVLKGKKSLPLQIELDTKVKVKIGGMKSKKVGIRVNCSRIKANLPTGKSPSVAATANAKCKVDLRIKIWKWTVG
ncbi:NDR1/HIN1-like protein 6 [Apium graveolens]|uniref:NDR1/HIN1-like protein 6 n=1 Tax=Apium graveolens TaxID=4045 RepID=UPI003D7A7718